MPARKNRRSANPIGVGLTAKQMKRRKPIDRGLLANIEAITDNQQHLFEEYDRGQNIVAYGCAGTGKTFVTLYKALEEVLDENSPYERVYLVRSLVATREIGFLPGDHDDKSALYQIPYKNMVKHMFDLDLDTINSTGQTSPFEMLYGNLMAQETLKFWSTSFLRGTTLDKAIIIVDEFQNLNGHELDSIMTRVGLDSKIHFCGDATQSDLTKASEKTGIMDFLSILERMPSVSKIEFGLNDIVRSGICREYLVAKHESGIEI